MAKTKAKKRERQEKLDIEPLVYQLKYQGGAAHQEIVWVRGEKREGLVLTYSVPSKRDIALEKRASFLLQMLFLAAEYPGEYTKVIPFNATEEGRESFQEILDWAHWNQDAIAEAVEWWNEDHPDYPVTRASFSEGTDWPALLFLLTGIGAVSTAAAAILDEG